MRVGVDVSVLAHPKVAGRRNYLKSLLPALLRAGDVEWVLLFSGDRRAVVEALPVEADAPHVRLVRLPALARLFHRGLWSAPVPAPALPRGLELDVFHVGEFYFPRALGGAAPVVTVHDLTTLVLPHCHPAAGRLRDRRQFEWMKRARPHCIAVSAATAHDLTRLLGIPPEGIDVVHEAAAQNAPPLPPQEVRRAAGVGDAPFILHVGTLEPRKNLVRLIRAFEALADELVPWRLVLAGRPGWRYDPILSAARDSRVSERIHVLGGVPDPLLSGLYNAAEVVAYPSLYEGFGLPVLEAMRVGRAVLTSDRSSLPEVAGDAALLVDPESGEAIRAGLERLLRDPALRAELGRRGRERAEQFTWSAAAEGTLRSYRRAVQRRAGRAGRSV